MQKLGRKCKNLVSIVNIATVTCDFWVVRRFDFDSIHLMANSALMSQLQYKNVADFPHVYVSKNCPS